MSPQSPAPVRQVFTSGNVTKPKNEQRLKSKSKKSNIKRMHHAMQDEYMKILLKPKEW